MATKNTFALLVSGRNDPLDDLKAALKNQGIEIWSARSCEEVEHLLDQTHPELVFTDTSLSDGTWANIVSLAEQASVPTAVVVVAAHPDTQLYISTMEHGAFDFIVPPFEADAMNHVLRTAVESVRRQRDRQAMN